MRQDIHRVLAGQQVTAPMAAVAETRAMAPTAVAPAATQTYRQTRDDLLPPGGGDDEVEDARARRNRGLAYFLLGLAIVAVAVGAYALINNMGKKDDNKGGGGNPTNSTSTPVKVSVPDVQGLTTAQAKTRLAEYKLVFAQGDSVPNSTIGKGKAISSRPRRPAPRPRRTPP